VERRKEWGARKLREADAEADGEAASGDFKQTQTNGITLMSIQITYE